MEIAFMKISQIAAKKFDFWLLFLGMSLSLLGIVFLYSLALSSGNFLFFKKQVMFLSLGILLVLLISFLNIKALKESSIFVFALYFLLILLLSGLFIFGENIRGQRGWYSFGQVTFEPVEIVKIVLVLFFAKFFSARHIEMYQTRHIFLSALYAGLPVFLVFLQPDFGSAVIIVFLWLSMMLLSGIKRKHLFVILGTLILLFLVLWNFLLTEGQKTRFITFIEPYLNPQQKYLDPEGTGYHIRQSLIAIGNGGWLGKGFSQALTQSKLGYLPEAHSDFIFAGLAEMFGMIGVALLLLLFFGFFWRLYKIGSYVKDNFSCLFVFGFFLLVLIQVFINIGMNLGILPITGIPLPFLSYGGSSLISLFVAIGMIEGLYLRSLTD